MTAPLVRPYPLEAGHPANHGYAPCVHCGVQRQLAKLDGNLPPDVVGPTRLICVDGCTPVAIDKDPRRCLRLEPPAVDGTVVPPLAQPPALGVKS